MNYYFYTKQIREMMKKAKASNTEQLLNIDEDTIYVRYCEELDDYMFQYSWIMNNEDNHLDKEVVKTINAFRKVKCTEREIFQCMDVVQVGVMTMFGLDYDDFSGMIGHIKNNNPLSDLRDTNYILCGNKLLRIVQKYNLLRDPFDTLDRIAKWNDSSIENTVQTKLMATVTNGIKYSYSDGNDIIFSLGISDKKTVFSEKADVDFPHYICVDNFLGTLVNNLEHTIN